MRIRDYLQHSIKTKIGLLILLIVTGILGIAESYDYGATRTTLSRELDELSARTVSRLAANLAFPLWELDETWIDQVIETEMLNRNVYAILVHGEGGLARGAQRDAEWRAIALSGGIGGDLVQRRQDILHHDITIGTVTLWVSRRFIAEHFRREALYKFSTTLAVAVSMILFLVGALDRIVIRPLQKISDAAKTIAAGDYSRDIAIPQQDEIGLLAGGIDSMRRDIRRREAELQHMQRELELRVAERTGELLRQQAFTETVLENINDGIVACDEHGILSLFNRATRELHGIGQEALTPEQWAGRYRLLQADGSLMPTERVPLFRAFQEQQVRDQELVIERADGSKRILLCAGQAMYDKEGRKIGAVVSMHDVSAQKQAEAELIQARDAAEAANRAKSMFLANMSHELRTPLNAILGFSEMLARDPAASAQQQEKLNVINRSGAHLLAMINDVLDLSKIEAGAVELEPDAFELPRLLEDIGRMIEVRAENADLRFVLEADPDMARYVMADSGKLRQILINLLGNAVKFTREGGVTLRARTLPQADDPDKVVLQWEVQDSGPGIPLDQQQRIFDAFVQAGHSTGNTKGTGLGLAISKSFVDLMGGTIGVDSEPDKGALFRVEIPVALATTAQAGETPRAAPMVAGLQPDQPAWRILIVEDNLENRLLLKGYLEPVGFAVREAENGALAVTEFERWQPHFIWMDIRMPVMDGFEATRRIRALPGGDTVKIVALTASVFKDQYRKILEAGCDDVLHKPFRAEKIFEAMGRYLGVRYRYAEEPGEAAPAQPTVHLTVHLTGAMLQHLPEELREALGEAAILLDIEACAAVIERIRDIDAETASGLQVLMKEYQFEQILKLLGKE